MLVDIDDEVLALLVTAATEGAAPDEVTPPLTPGTAWTPERIAWLHDFHRDRRPGLRGAAKEATWAVVVDGAIVGSVRLRRTEDPDVFEVGIWLIRALRGRGHGWSIMAEMVARAKALGTVRLRADTTTDNAAALAVLRDLGFTLTSDARGQDVHADLLLAAYPSRDEQ